VCVRYNRIPANFYTWVASAIAADLNRERSRIGEGFKEAEAKKSHAITMPPGRADQCEPAWQDSGHKTSFKRVGTRER